MEKCKNSVKLNYKSSFFILLFFLYAIDFNGMANDIFLFFAVYAVFFAGYGGKKITPENLLLFVFCTLYWAFSTFNLGYSKQDVIRYLIAPGVAAIVSYQYTSDEMRGNYLLATITWGLFAHATLNMLLSLSHGYALGSVDNIWGGKMSQTLQGLLMLPMAALLYPALKVKKKTLRTWFCLAGSIASLVFTTITGRRTLFFVFFIVVAVDFFADLIQQKKFTNFFQNLVTFLVVIAMLIIGYQNDFAGIKTSFSDSSLYYRLFLSQNSGRTLIHINVIKNAPAFIWGSTGLDASYGATYAHNLWLDTMVIAGWVPALLLVIYTIYVVCRMIRLVKKYGMGDWFVSAYFSINLAILLGFMVEPTLQGAPHVFVLWCAMNGIAQRVEKIKLNR